MLVILCYITSGRTWRKMQMWYREENKNCWRSWSLPSEYLNRKLRVHRGCLKNGPDSLYVHALTMFMLQKNKYPWMVDISLNSEFYCGGTLVASKYVVTRAECLFYSNDSAVATSDVQVCVKALSIPIDPPPGRALFHTSAIVLRLPFL